MIIIGIAGKMGVGKDYIANLLQQIFLKQNPDLKIRLIAFGDQLKVSCSITQNIPLNSMYGDKPQQIRKLLQQTATELGRNVVGEDVWIRYLQTWLEVYNIRETIDLVIIPDVRFKNEYEWIMNYGKHDNHEKSKKSKKSKGLVLYIQAPQLNVLRLTKECKGNNDVLIKISTHRSETELDHFPHTYVINNDHNLNLLTHLKEICSLLTLIY